MVGGHQFYLLNFGAEHRLDLRLRPDLQSSPISLDFISCL